MDDERSAGRPKHSECRVKAQLRLTELEIFVKLSPRVKTPSSRIRDGRDKNFLLVFSVGLEHPK